MKKTIFMLVAFALAVLMLTACGGSTENGEQASAPSSTTPSSGTLQGGVEDSVFDDEPTVPTQPTQGSTAPTQAATQPSTAPTQPSTVPTQPTTAPTQPTTAPTQPTTPSTEPTPVDPTTMDYETFRDMTPAEQRAFQETFPSLDAFFEWLDAAKEAYEKENPPIEVGGDGVVDLGNLGKG